MTFVPPAVWQPCGFLTSSPRQRGSCPQSASGASRPTSGRMGCTGGSGFALIHSEEEEV